MQKSSHLRVNLASNDRLTQRCELSAKIAKKRFAPLCKILETRWNLQHKVLKVLFQNFRSKSLQKSSHLRVNWTSPDRFIERCELSAGIDKKRFALLRTFGKNCSKKVRTSANFRQKLPRKGSHLCVNSTSTDRFIRRCELPTRIAQKRFAPLRTFDKNCSKKVRTFV